MMDYKEMTEIVTREVEARLQKKRERARIIKRASYTVSTICAALIVCLGVLHYDEIKSALHRDDLIQPTDSSSYETDSTHSDVTSALLDPNIVTSPSVSSQTAAISTDTQPVITNTETGTISGTSPSETAATSGSVFTETAEATSVPVHSSIVSATAKPPNDRTTATTADQGSSTTTTIDQNHYRISISFLDDTSFDKIGNVNAKLIQQRIEWTDAEHSIDIGERKEVARWNSSESNPFIANFSKDISIEYRYIVMVDVLPDGYSYYGKNNVEYNISGYFDGTKDVEILLSTEEATQNDIPLSGTYSLKLSVMDFVRNEKVAGLDCELFNLQSGEAVAAWNTSETDEIYVENLRYFFDKPDSYNGNITYAIRITNLPENYRFYYGKSREFYGISGFSLEEFANGTELRCIAYLEDTSIDAPKYHYG